MEEKKDKKKKSMGDLLKEISKKFSKSNPDIVFNPDKQYEAVSSGNLIFDLISGIGGFPKGRITEICAMESTGKTSLLYAAIGAAQRKGLVSVLFDFEQCFDPHYAESCYGIKLDGKTFFLFQPITIEEGDAIFDTLMESADINFDLVCFDSIACMKPQAILDASLEDNAIVGAHARMISRFTHKLKKECYLKNFAAVLTNQFQFQIARDQWTPGIGVAAGHKHKDQFTTPGGIAPRFLASMRYKLELSSKESREEVDPLSGEREELVMTRLVKFINLKNKCSRPELKGISHFDVVTPEQRGGWNTNKDLMELLRRRGRVTQVGAAFKYEGLSQTWEARGKANGEYLFLNTPEIISDAFQLLDKLRAEDVSGNLLVDKARLGIDIQEDEIRGQENSVPEPIPEPEKKGKKGKPKPTESGDVTL